MSKRSRSSSSKENYGANKVVDDAPPIPESDGDDSDFDEERVAVLNCDQVRRRIRTFLEKPGVTQTAFIKRLNVNSKSYRCFMKLKGPFSGSGNGTFWAADRFFAKHPKIHLKKRVSSGGAKKQKTEQLAEIQKAMAAKVDESAIFLSPAEVRRRATAYFKATQYPKAPLLKALALNSNSYGRFMTSGKGGHSNSAYPKLYFFFEAVDKVQGKKKSKQRLEREAVHARLKSRSIYALNRATAPTHNMGVWARKGDPVPSFASNPFEASQAATGSRLDMKSVEICKSIMKAKKAKKNTA